MGLGIKEDTPKKRYISIAEGNIVLSENGQKRLYKYVEGHVRKVYKLDRTFNGETVQYWYIDLEGKDKEIYSLSLPYRSGTFKSIILALANLPTIGIAPVKIEPYLKDRFTKVVVSSGGNKLDWITKTLPEVKEITVAGQTVKDDTARMEYIESLVKEINSLL